MRGPSKVNGVPVDQYLPRGILPGGFLLQTAPQGGITATVVLTGLSTTVAFQAGRRYRISLYIPWSSNTTNDVAGGIVGLDGAQILLVRGTMGPTTTNSYTLTGYAILDCVEGSSGTGFVLPGVHTVDLRLGRSVGTGTLTTNPSTQNPAQLVIEDVGAADV